MLRRFWRIQNPTYRGAVVGLICALACCLLNDLVVMRGAENWALDNCFVLRGKRYSSAEVVVVGIDEDSLRELKKPLTFISPELGEVVRFLDTEGASAIGIDFFIPADAEDRAYFRPGSDGDADQLGKAIAQSKKVVLPEWQLGDQWLSPLFQWKAKNEIDPAWTDLGFVNLTTDNDTFLRRQQLRAKTADNEAKPQFGLAVFGLAEKKDEAWFTAKSLMLDGREIPTESGRMLINFVGPPGTIKAVPFHSVLKAARGDATALSQSWKGKTVLVGVTAYTYQDRHATAYSNQAAMWAVQYFTSSPKLDRMAGTEIQANIVATLKDRAFLVQPLGKLTTPFALLLIGPLLGIGFARLSLGWGALLTILHHWLWKLICIAAFSWLN
ncbi:MAG: CHASE2 domain-containing protein [Planctomycetaceae bacterium]|nr:CHASE2 domain-containing protein [Planctomycetaceae bacterium]